MIGSMVEANIGGSEITWEFSGVYIINHSSFAHCYILISVEDAHLKIVAWLLLFRFGDIYV